MAPLDPTPVNWSPRAATPVVEAGWPILQRRQGPPPNPYTSTISSSNTAAATTTQSDGQGGGLGGLSENPPSLSLFTYAIAIVLFVLVVVGVLLRIWRNRRLQRLGIQPESRWERLLTGTVRQYEDTLPPPKLWEARIADVQAHHHGTWQRSEKGNAPYGFTSSASGGPDDSVGQGQNGWDALMPVAAALPPSLYPLIFAQDAANAAATAAQTNSDGHGATNGADASAGTRGLGRRMPNFLRRTTGASESDELASGMTPGVEGNALAIAEIGLGDTYATLPAMDEKVAASVNITVLIAMPSPKTVFPSMRMAPTRPLDGSATLLSQDAKLNEVDEEDALSDKGKARRAPSLRSIRSTASLRSLAGARREAFFKATATPAEELQTQVMPTLGFGGAAAAPEEEEEEELPELVFGTASVPLYMQIAPSMSVGPAQGTTTDLLSPTREQIMDLMTAVSEAKTKRAERAAAAAAAAKAALDKSQTEPKSVDAEANRPSVAETSLEGGLSTSEDRPAVGNVVPRLVGGTTTNGADPIQAESYELDDLRAPASSPPLLTPSTADPLISDPAANGGLEQQQQLRRS